jgi:predicted amidophosphoribosyltransferase
MENIKVYVSRLISLLFPESCILCNKLGKVFCPLCQKSIKFSLIKKQISLKTEKTTHDYSLYENITLYYSTDYQKIKKILHSIKFDHNNELITFWSKSNDLKKIIDKMTKDISGPILSTIVPSHKNRLSKRGFNLILDLYSGHLTNSQKYNDHLKFIPDFFSRIKDTKPLYELDKKNRSIQLNNAFAITSKHRTDASTNRCLNFKNKTTTLIIFDDICTTGQTLLELKKLTKRLHFKEVIAFSLAFQSL